MSFVVTCWERADLWALVCGVYLWVYHFTIGILGQVWYLIVSIPDLCILTYFYRLVSGCLFILSSLFIKYNLLYELWQFNKSDLGWKVKGLPWHWVLIYSNCLHRLTLSRRYNDFCFNRNWKINYSRLFPLKCIRMTLSSCRLCP